LLEAKKVSREALIGTGSIGNLDFSDVQELRVKLVRRDSTLCPEQERWLRRLDTQIAAGSISQAEFRNETAELLAMPNSLSLQHRRDELHFNREDRLRQVAR
jgi:hypothetical protein